MNLLRRKLIVALGAAAAVAAGAYGFIFQRRERGLERALVLERAGRALDARDPARARALASELLARDPNDVDALLVRGDAGRVAGDYNEARTDYLRAADATASRPEPRARLFDLTWAAGAHDEARHHLSKLEEILGPRAPEVASRRATSTR